MKTISLDPGDPMYIYQEELVREGIEKGIEKGIEQTAGNMIAKGFSDEQIAEVTSLEIKRIRQLRKERS